ncbi:hypothetical protein [Allosphingosinicella sp.]|jgi:hypothetical protein|uniref:hypothetical protein n=1 Tax=Allosphingosinicella sp. TaxID=2823234 RepID=UPI002EE0D764
MTSEPSYPEDSPVGTPPADGQEADGPSAAKGEQPRRTKHLMTGAAIGIGSAALVAALLYANRSKRGDKSGDG